MEQRWVVETEGQAIADALVGNHASVLVQQAREFVLVGRWADVHDEDSLTARDGAGRVLPGTERARQLGGHGTPRVAEFACADLAVLLGVGYIAASHLVRDALDVRERHPRLWTQITATAAADPTTIGDGRVCGVQVWQAREVAKACHVAGLTRDRARWVDEETTPLLGTMPWGRFLGKLAAAVIDADPDAADAKRRAEAMRQFVATGQCNEYGLKTLILKAQAGDVICLNALFDRIARILQLEGDTDPYDVRKAKATGIVANPYEAVRLLEKYATTTIDAAEDHVDANDTQDDSSARGEDSIVVSEDSAAGATATAAGASETHEPEPKGDAPERTVEADLDPAASGEQSEDSVADAGDADDASETDTTGPAADEPEAAVDASSDVPDDEAHPDRTPGANQASDRGQGVLDLFGDRRIDPLEPTADTPYGRCLSNLGAAGRPAGQGKGPRHSGRDNDQEHGRDSDSDPGSANGPSPHGSPPSGPPPSGPPGGSPPDGPPPHDSPPIPGPPGRLRPGDLHPADDDSEDQPHAQRQVTDPCPSCGGTGAPTVDAWRRVDPDKLLPHATVYVHLSQESFLRGTGGVARFENGIGPVTVEQAVEFLGHRRVTVKPVIDLARQVPVDGYEVPARLREAVRLARPASVFPYSTSRAPSMDLDHTTPYLPLSQGGKPGQTGLHNLAPLQRFEHRVKTHARGWVLRQPEPGVYLWRNRYGYWYRVDPTGTHPLGKHPDLADHQPTGHQQPAARRYSAYSAMRGRLRPAGHPSKQPSRRSSTPDLDRLDQRAWFDQRPGLISTGSIIGVLVARDLDGLDQRFGSISGPA